MARLTPMTTDAPNTGASLGPEATHVDERGREYIIWPDGSKFYTRPRAGSPLWFEGSTGGLVHKPDTWNPQTGEWEKQGVDWGKLGPWLGLAAIGGVSAAAALSSAGPAAVTAANTSAATGATGGTAAGAGGTLAATSTVPATGALATGSIASGAVPAAVAAGTGGPSVASTSGIIGKLGGWGSLVNLGANFGAQYLQNRANSSALDRQIAASERAAEIEAQSQREALDFAKAAYGREQEQLAPYVGAGGAAVTKLSQLMGLGTPPPYKPLPVQAPPPAAPGVLVGDPRLGSVSQLAGGAPPASPMPQANNAGGMVLMQAPDGSRRPVPQALVAQAQSKGAVVVNANA